MLYNLKNNTLIIKPLSDITISSAEDYRKKFLDAFNNSEDINDINIDLSNVKYIDSSGISIILGFYKTASSKNIGFRITNLKKQLTYIFTMLKFDKLFKIDSF